MNHIRIGLSLGVACLLGVAGRGEEPVPPRPAEEARRAVAELSVLPPFFKALGREETFRAGKDELANTLRAALRAGDPPALDRLRADFLAAFDERFEKQIRPVAEALARGDDRLASWLREYASRPRDPVWLAATAESARVPWLRECATRLREGQPVSLREAARGHWEDYLARPEGLAADWTRAREEVAAEQVAEVRRSLRAEHYPDPERLEKVYADPRCRPDLVRDLERDLAGDRRLLEETRRAVTDLAEEMVTSGLLQLQGQLGRLEAEPVAHTRPGMVREFADRLDGYTKSLKLAAGVRLYPVFPEAARRAEQAAAEHFGKRVAGATGRIARQVAAGEQALPESLPQRFRADILGNPVRHHTAEESAKTFEPVMGEQVMAFRGQVADALLEVARAGGSRFDQPEDLAGLAVAVAGVLRSNDGAAGKESAELAEVVRKKAAAILQAVRREVAREQARRCPALAAGSWKPSENIIQNSDPKEIHTPWLLACPDLWRDRPPAEPEWLEETWQLLAGRAREAVEIGKQALHGQLALVADLQPEMVRQIQARPGLGSTHWASEYEAEVGGRWRQGRSVACARYPALFRTTHTQMEGIVAGALRQAVREAQHALAARSRPDLEAGIRQDPRPAFEPHFESWRGMVAAAWKENPLAARHPGLLAEVEEWMRGVVQKCVNARVEALAAEARLRRADAERRAPEVLAREQEARQQGAGAAGHEGGSRGGQERPRAVADPPDASVKPADKEDAQGAKKRNEDNAAVSSIESQPPSEDPPPPAPARGLWWIAIPLLAVAGAIALGVFLYRRERQGGGQEYGGRILALLLRLGPDPETRLRRLSLVVCFFDLFRDQGERELEDRIACHPNRQAGPPPGESDPAARSTAITRPGPPRSAPWAGDE